MTEAVAHAAPEAPARPLPAEAIGDTAFRIGVAACAAAVGTFLLVRLTAWPPHEDETLALFVGRESLGGLFDTVIGQRGGAPLHFLLAWVVAHSGGGLVGLRVVSAIFATASVPLVALLCARLAGRAAALVATVIVAGGWMLLFHGVYGRMYSLFLFTSLLSFLALHAATERGGWRAWTLWVVATLLCVATHPYGALVFAVQGVYVALARARVREAISAFAAVAVLGIPFWLTDLRLAGRFEVGVGGGGEKLGNPVAVLTYLRRVAGDFTAGYTAAVTIALVLALVGLVVLARRRPRSALLVGCVIAVPTAVLLLARLGSATSPESRHLVFALPFFCLLVAVGLVKTADLGPRALAPAFVVLVLAALVSAEVAWGWHKTPELYRGETSARVAARDAAAEWLAATSRPDDVLFGYEPLYLAAWERGGRVSKLVVPRADAKLALRTLRAEPGPLGRGVWVFDASDTNNFVRRLEIPLTYPEPASAYEARTFGPFLVVRTRRPTGTVRTYLKMARRAELVGKSLFLGDADINLVTVLQASGRLAHEERAASHDRP